MNFVASRAMPTRSSSPVPCATSARMGVRCIVASVSSRGSRIRRPIPSTA